MNPSSWRVVAASVRGQRHIKTAQPCQDAHQWRLLPGNVLIAAVADGAGSASLAEQGAATAVRATMDFLGGQTTWPPASADPKEWNELLRKTVITAREELLNEALKGKVAARELASTLLFMIATPELVAAVQVGDGAIVIKAPDGQWSSLTRPNPTEYLNETVFLTSADAVDKAQFALHAIHTSQVALLSDGLQMLALKMPESVPHAPFFNPLLRLTAGPITPVAAHEQLIAFLQSPRVSERTDDDLTLVLASRSEFDL
jgi:hypothetical protein